MSGRQYRAILAIAAGMIGVSASAAPSAPRSANACLAHVPEAAARSGLPQDIIMRVMIAESGGDDHAISPKGAMGCMQIMPATWAMLTARYGLGSDPWDARASMIAGSLYLAGLAQRYGFPGAYAAYNAGDTRWLRYRDNGEPLPTETVAYMARLGSGTPVASREPPRSRWQEAGLFMARDGNRQTPPADSEHPEPRPNASASEPGVPVGQSLLFPLAGPTLTERE